MEINEVDQGDVSAPKADAVPWDMHEIRKLRNLPPDVAVVHTSKSVQQRVYRFDDALSAGTELAIRRCRGLSGDLNHSELIWLNATFDDHLPLLVGIKPAYIFDRTGCLIKPDMLPNQNAALMPFIEIAKAVLNDIEAVLNLHVENFNEPGDEPESDPRDFISLDHKGTPSLLVLSDSSTLDLLEVRVRDYCTAYWDGYAWLGQRVQYEFGIYVLPRKRLWDQQEIASLEVGDLVATQCHTPDEGSRSLQAVLRLQSDQFKKKQYEVFLQMTENETMLRFDDERLSDVEHPQDLQDGHIAAHEKIELEIYAGKTKITFNDLCAVQEGALIELQEHALPQVTLCVMGTPIFEAELVHFQDQLMLQVIKKLG